jgi:hypothetical protein
MSVGEEKKEPEDQDVEDVLDEELDTPVIRLRRRLGSLKDVVAKHGPPKPRPKLKRSYSSPWVMDDEYHKKVVAPRNAMVE